MPTTHPIGIFDSGYGGLTVLKSITEKLPDYDFIYLGDNARAPYGNRSFQTVYHYSWQCVQWFFNRGCPLVILACNTASAKALRTIQQINLPAAYPDRRVLGVIRPTTEIIGLKTKTGQVGILATSGTVESGSYQIEINKFFPAVRVFQQACPIWVPLIENNEQDNPGADYFVSRYVGELLRQGDDIDTVLLGCTHYPLLQRLIAACLPSGTAIVSQGGIVADSLADYLARHPDIDARCSRQGQQQFFTTDSTEDFDRHAKLFYGRQLSAKHLDLSGLDGLAH